MKLNKLTAFILILTSFGLLNAQNTLDDVHLFQGFFHDATIAPIPYVDGGVAFSDYEYGSIFNIHGKGGYALNENIEIGALLGFSNVSHDGGDGHSGLQDLFVTGRYKFNTSGITKLAAGGYLTLPTGSEDIGAGNLNFGGYGAVRHPLNNGMVIVGTLGLDFIETTKYEMNDDFEMEEKTEYESSFLLGGGVIYPHSDQVNIIGELHMKTEGDYMLLSGGADYKLSETGRVRGMLGLGLDDGAPDFIIMGSYLLNL